MRRPTFRTRAAMLSLAALLLGACADAPTAPRNPTAHSPSNVRMKPTCHTVMPWFC
jgi:hypothetical protein